ncbi:MAG: inositol monophosphatase family protein [Anaerolineales bacterium]|nr:inositol monophosphatase family protein [Anaerolineales bacterium]
MFGTYHDEAEFALGAVEQAAELCRWIQRDMVVPELTKDDRSPVTVADFASQAIVASRLLEAYPEDSLVAEEGSQDLRRPRASEALRAVVNYVRELEPAADAETVWRWLDHGSGEPSGRFWTLDPIDGTAGFLRGDQWAVALALVEGGDVVMGVLACPRLDPAGRPDFDGPGSVQIGVRGEGAWSRAIGGGEFQQLRVSEREDPSEARILGSVEPSHTDMHAMDRLRERLGSQHDLIKMDSQAKFTAVACGRGDLILRLLAPDRLEYREKIWDQAAGSRVVQEAGGRVTDLRGRPLDFTAGERLTHNVGVLVSNGELHEPALRALRAEGAHHPEIEL